MPTEGDAGQLGEAGAVLAEAGSEIGPQGVIRRSVGAGRTGAELGRGVLREPQPSLHAVHRAARVGEQILAGQHQDLLRRELGVPALKLAGEEPAGGVRVVLVGEGAVRRVGGDLLLLAGQPLGFGLQRGGGWSCS